MCIRSEYDTYTAKTQKTFTVGTFKQCILFSKLFEGHFVNITLQRRSASDSYRPLANQRIVNSFNLHLRYPIKDIARLQSNRVDMNRRMATVSLEKDKKKVVSDSFLCPILPQTSLLG